MSPQEGHPLPGAERPVGRIVVQVVPTCLGSRAKPTAALPEAEAELDVLVATKKTVEPTCPLQSPAGDADVAAHERVGADRMARIAPGQFNQRGVQLCAQGSRIVTMTRSTMDGLKLPLRIATKELRGVDA